MIGLRVLLYGSLVTGPLLFVEWKFRFLAFIPVGFLAWQFIEYFFHRAVFHRGSEAHKVVYNHAEHHRQPSAMLDLLLPLRLTLPVSAMIVLPIAVINASVAAFFYVGLLAGYGCYEWIHYQAHHSLPRYAVLKRLRAYHLHHHHSDSSRHFGVSSPLVDWLCRTL